jgi:hypothetical protein
MKSSEIEFFKKSPKIKNLNEKFRKCKENNIKVQNYKIGIRIQNK